MKIKLDTSELWLFLAGEQPASEMTALRRAKICDEIIKQLPRLAAELADTRRAAMAEAREDVGLEAVATELGIGVDSARNQIGIHRSALRRKARAAS